MQLRNVSLASLRRRPARAAFTAGVVAIALATVVALVTLSRVMQAEISDELDRFGANIIVTPRTQSLDLAYGGLAVGGLTVDVQQLRAEDADAVRTIPNRKNLNAVAPRLVGWAEVAGRRLLLTGVRHRDEARVKSWWQIDGRRAGSATEVLLGVEAARALALGPGATLVLDGHARTVAGVLRPTGTLDDAAVIADLAVVQRVLRKPGEVNLIEVSALCSGCPIEHMVDQIAAVLPHARVAPIRQAVAAREQAVAQFTKFAYALSVVVLLVGMTVVAATMTASVVERTQEIGILRAIGYRRTQVGRIVLNEVFVVTVTGALAGWVGGVLAARQLAPAVAATAASTWPDPSQSAVAIAATVALGLLAGGYPAVRAARLEPSLALRHL